MDTSTEEGNSFHSNTDAIIHAPSDVSGWTQSLLSDPNITSSSSTSADDHQYIWRASVSRTDDGLTVSVSTASSRISAKQIQNVNPLNLSKPKEQVQLEELPKGLITPSRTRIKVHMQGVAIGRTVDLTVLNDYDELINELEGLFDIKGELRPRIKWQVVFVDDEDDIMLVGDYPWPEFCKMARKLYIYSSEELKNLGAK